MAALSSNPGFSVHKPTSSPLLSISFLSLSLSLCSRSHPSGQSLLIFGFSSFLLICLLGPPSLFGCLGSSGEKKERKNNRRKTIWCHVFACASGCFINCQLILPLITKWRPITQQKKKKTPLIVCSLNIMFWNDGKVWVS